MNDPHHGLPQAGIIGSGIAGLCAAIALRRAGWSCELFERSSFAHEIGAAISVTPNATRCLAHWGFDFAKARPVQNQQLRFMMAKDLDVVFRSEYANLEERFGYPAWSFHRVDLHRGLRDVALREQGAGVPAIVRLGCRVEGVDFETGRIVLANGESVKKDLVIVADGAHSSIVEQMTGSSNPLEPTGRSIYRCLIPMHEVMSDPDVRALYEGQRPGFVGILDPIDDVLFMNYPCRDNEIMNYAIVHNSKQSSHELTSWNEPVSWTEILDTAHAFHPTAKKMLKMTSHLDSDIKVHHLTKRAPLSSFVHGRAVVIGDAAHTMMPTHAAGGAVTIESAAAMEVLFDKVSDEGVIADRLKLFDKVRVGRCNMAMILSNSGFAGVKIPGVLEELRRYYDGPLPPEGAMPWSPESREVFFNYDAFEEARKVLVEEKDEGDKKFCLVDENGIA